MSEQEMVLVPRELLNKLRDECYHNSWDLVPEIDACASVELAPAAYQAMTAQGGWASCSKDCHEIPANLKEKAGSKTRALYAGPPSPIILPDRNTVTLTSPLKIPPGYTVGMVNYELQIWRSCLDMVAELNK